MKTQRARERISAKRSAPAPVQSPARRLLAFPGEVSQQTVRKANAQVSGAWRNAANQLSGGWRIAARLLSCAWKGAKEHISGSWKSLRTQQIARSRSKRLQVAATASLGEKRFVAVIQVDGREFLVGGGATNVALLAQLDAKNSFNGMLTEAMNVPGEIAPEKQPAKQVRKRMVAAVEQVGDEA